MTEKRVCRNCYFSKIAKRIDDGYGLERTNYEVLECHRYAPRHISGVGTGKEENLFPEIDPENWCGEYYKNPNEN